MQSTCLLLMCLRGEYARPDCAIFSDTGWEPRGVYEHLERLQRECKKEGLPLHVVSAGNIKEDTTAFIKNEKGRLAAPPFFTDAGKGGAPLVRQCTKEYKINPIITKVRSLVGVKPKVRVIGKRVEQWFGISLDEAQRMKDSHLKWIQNVYPLVDMRMDRHNCQQWLTRNGWGETPKSACIGCPYHRNAMWRDMKINHPDEFADAVAFDHYVRSKGNYPRARGKVYLHRSLIPLDEVDFSNEEDRGQMGFSFLDECEGMCGV